MSAALEAYNRLIAAQREITEEDRAQYRQQREREELNAKIKRRLPKIA